MAALLRIVEGVCQGLWLTIPNGATITFGRAADASYDFEDSLLSREHCAFQCKGKACRVADLKSRNGTFVNGERIAAPRVLKVGDHVKLGSIVLELMKVGILRELVGAPLPSPQVPGVTRVSALATTDDAVAPVVLGRNPLESGPIPQKGKRASKRLSKRVQRDLAKLGEEPAPATPVTPGGADIPGIADRTAIVDPPFAQKKGTPPTVPLGPAVSLEVAEEIAAARAAIGEKAGGPRTPAPTPPTIVVGPPVPDTDVPAFGVTPAAPPVEGAIERTIVVDSPAAFASPPAVNAAFTAPTAPFPFVVPVIPGVNAPVDAPPMTPAPPPPPAKGRKTKSLRKSTEDFTLTAAPAACEVCRTNVPQQELRPVRGKLACARCAERFDLNPDLIDGFKLIERVRKTRTGTVYKAEQTLLRRLVLVKTLETSSDEEDQKNLQRFMREAKTAGRLRHPSIVELYDVNDQGGQRYLVMEFVEGETLEQIISRGPLPVGQTVRYMHHTGDALFHAHDQQVIHRDFRPSTIVIDRQSDQAKVADFSLAKTDEGTPYSVTGGSEYTVPYYMPPEQVIGGTRVDAKSDIYSYGATYYHVLSGRVPLEARKLSELVRKLKSEDPPPLSQVAPQVPRELSELIMKCLSKDPKDRYDDMTALMNDLSAIQVALKVYTFDAGRLKL
ncbi:protein kinase, partial [bacterium]|nr:protein kinase [bacterium]